jgi:hypothetical protein
MFVFGFSTGALALGDFRRALDLLRGQGARAVELSALRDHELPILMDALGGLDLGQFDYVSVHAPSRLASLTEGEVAERLLPCVERGWPVVLHPDAIRDPGCWRTFGPLVCIENMDKRKRTGRTATELRRFFSDLPEASLCLDLAHARQIDTTMGVARSILAEFGGDRLAQVHLSELDARGGHAPLSMATVLSVREVAHFLKPVPIIIESRVAETRVADELRMAESCFQPSRMADGGVRAAV